MCAQAYLGHVSHSIDGVEAGSVVKRGHNGTLVRDDSRVAIGQTSGGRYLRVIYVSNPEPRSVFVITAYELRGKPLVAYRRRRRRKAKCEKGMYPQGWDEARVKRVLAHYESQSEEEAVAEDEAAFEATDQTVVGIPTELVPKVRQLIAKHRAARERPRNG